MLQCYNITMLQITILQCYNVTNYNITMLHYRRWIGGDSPSSSIHDLELLSHATDPAAEEDGCVQRLSAGNAQVT